MSITVAPGHADTLGRLAKRARGQLMMLSAQFLLGMGVNLIGLPSETTGGAKVATNTLLGFHILTSVGLIVGAALVIRRASRLNRGLVSRAVAGGVLVVVTVVAGVLAWMLESNLWSYVMAVGFIGLFVVYGDLLLRARTSAAAATLIQDLGGAR